MLDATYLAPPPDDAEGPADFALLARSPSLVALAAALGSVALGRTWRSGGRGARADVALGRTAQVRFGWMKPAHVLTCGP